MPYKDRKAVFTQKNVTSSYQVVEKTYPNDKRFRFKGFPKDAFLFACGSHKARLLNILKSPGIDLIEKSLLKQRLVNITVGQNGYLEKQRKALSN